MQDSVPSRRYAVSLWVLFALFLFRVVAQPLSLVVHLAILPPFDSWYSGLVSYGLLLGSQVVILAVEGWTAWRFTIGAVTPRRWLGVAALIFGSLYFVSMVARLVLGLTVLSDSPWFAHPVPTLFHLPLAGFVVLFGRFHYVHGGTAASGR
jgi:hypothetical protein